MSWIEKLYQTYENNTGKIANPNDTIPLLPLFHTTQNAQLHVVLDGTGNLVDASVVTKDDAPTIIPATEASAGRAGAKIAPHALFDTLQYVAGDYLEYGGNPNKKKNESGFNPYIHAVERWVESAGNRKLQAVFTYLKKGHLIKDLIEKKVLVAGNNGMLAMEWTGPTEEAPSIFKVVRQANKKGQFEAFVRFSVEIPGDNPPELWRDTKLRESWGSYYATLQSKSDLCMVTGKTTNVASNHPKNIRYPGDGAKLVSSNDTEGYTYLGRFTSDAEACCIGIEVTQKAHSALRWLIERQGKRDGDQAFVAWAVSGADVPDLHADTFSFLFSGDQTPPPKTGYTAQEVGVALSRKMAGYSAKLKSTDDVVVLGLDSATPGRMAISYYRELTGSEFLERIESWHTGCCWQQYFGKDRIFFGAPAPRDIAEVAFGRRIDDKLRKATMERLLPCIIDGAPIPRDLVESCVRRVTSRQSFPWKWGQVSWAWEKALGIACALYRKQNEKEGYRMALDENRTTRDYLYGRLLALAENIEHWAINIGGEKRQTNAERMMQRFADRPYSTWRTIELALVPYKTRLGHKATKLNAMIDAVHCKFDTPEEYSRDTKLSGEFLLGYHCQRSALKPVAGPTTPDSVDKTEESED